MRGSSILCVSFVHFFFLATPLFAYRVSSQSTDDTPNLRALEQTIRTILDETGVPGVGIALIHGGESFWTGGIGLADRGASRPASADTIYRLGSISKTFIGLAAMKLHEEGKLDLRDRVESLAPEIEFTNPWENTDPVRFVHLLEHTAGIHDMDLNEFGLDGRTIAQSGPRQVRWKPGTFFTYSNVGPNIAAYLIEKIAGQSFEEYIRAHFLEPLQMNSSGFSLDKEENARLAPGYHHDGSTPVPFQEVPLRASGSFYSTPNDLGRFLEFMLNRGMTGEVQLLEEDSLQRMETPSSPLSARTGLMVGYGLGIDIGVQEGLIVHGHVGGIDSYRARYAYSTGHQIGYAVLISSPRDDVLNRISNEVLRFLTQDKAPPVPPTPADVPVTRLRALTGYYVSATQNRDMLRFIGNLIDVVRIEISGDRVLADPFSGEPERLIPVTDRRFRGENEPLPTIVFVEDGDDLLILAHSAALGGNYRSRPLWMVWSLWLVAASCLMLVTSAPLFAAVWLPRLWAGQIDRQEPISTRVWPLIASFLLIAAGVVIWALPVDYISFLGHLSIWSLGLYLLSWLFPIFSLLAVIQCLRVATRPKSQSVWFHSLAVSVACLLIAGYLAYFGMIGIKTW